MPSRRPNRGTAHPHPDPVALQLALTVEQVSLSTYTAMTAILRSRGKMPLMKLSLHAGISYWCARNQIRRTPYFGYEALPGTKLRVIITPEGREKFARIRRRVKDIMKNGGL